MTPNFPMVVCSCFSAPSYATSLLTEFISWILWKQFQLINSVSKEVAYEGALKQEQTTIGKFGVMDFTDFNQPGDYQLKVGKNITPAFRIGEKLWDNSLWKVLNFLFCQRCGHPVPGKHAACHTDLFSRHDGKSIAYSGGWHDAGEICFSS